MEVIVGALVAIDMVCVLVLLLLRKTIGAYLSAKNDYREAARLLLNAKAALEKAIQDYRNTENELKETKAAYSILNMSIEQEPKKSIEGDGKNGEVSDDCGPAMISASVKRFRLRDGHTVPEKFSARLKDCIIVGLDAEGSFIEQRNEGADWDFARFWVYDNEFCQPYTPFYDALNGKPVNEFCAEVVERYNEVMSSQGWLEEVDAE